MDDKEQLDNIITTTSSQVVEINAEDVPVTLKDKYRYYYKNFIVQGIVIITGYGSVFASINLLTMVTGKSLGFAAFIISFIVALLTLFIVPAGTQSIGTRRSLVLANLFFLLFVSGQFYMAPYAIIPAAICNGIGNALFWTCSATYLSKLAVDYANRCNNHSRYESMISFANGYVMACFGAGILLGTALSSSILFSMDEQSVPMGNESCNLRQTDEDIDPYDASIMILRGVLLLGSCIAFVTVLFVDEVKGEAPVYAISSFLSKLKSSYREFLQLCIKEKPYILLAVPMTVTSSMVQGYILGSFPKEYISECVGVGVAGYATMAFTFAVVVSGFLTGKFYLAYLPRYVVGIITSLMTLALLIFLLAWERQPSYAFIFVFMPLWGVADGQWNTFCPSYIAHMLHEQLVIAYTAYSACFLLGYVAVFVAAFMFDVQGVQWVMTVSVCGSLPLYLIAEWLKYRKVTNNCRIDRSN